MLETAYVGDIFERLVADLKYWWPILYTEKITKIEKKVTIIKSPTSLLPSKMPPFDFINEENAWKTRRRKLTKNSRAFKFPQNPLYLWLTIYQVISVAQKCPIISITQVTNQPFIQAKILDLNDYLMTI